MGSIDENDITATIVREGKPEGLFRHLEGKGVPITVPHRGIYCIQGDGLFPTQILVAKELEQETHIWLKALSEKLRKEDLEKLLERVKRLTGEYGKEMADTL